MFDGIKCLIFISNALKLKVVKLKAVSYGITKQVVQSSTTLI